MAESGSETPRLWTWTTTVKLEVLEQYLSRFTTASQYKAHGNTVYLDLFAGGLDNVNKMTGESFPGSAELALRTVPEFRTTCSGFAGSDGQGMARTRNAPPAEGGASKGAGCGCRRSSTR